MTTRDVLSSTVELMKSRAVDNLYQRVTIFEQAKAKGGLSLERGGASLSLPLFTEEAGQLTELFNGYEAVNLATAPQLDKANYNWAAFARPIILSDKEARENRGTEARVDILKTKIHGTMGIMERELSRRILQGAVPTSAPSTQLATLRGVASAANSYLPGVGVAGGTVGGVSRSGVVGLNNQAETLANSYSNLIDRMTKIRIRAAASSPLIPKHVWIVNEEFFAGYKGQLQQNERYIDAKALDGGRLELAFDGSPVIYDPNMETFGSPNQADVLAYCINFEHIKFYMLKDGNFDLEDKGSIPGSVTRAWFINWHGQFAADHLASSGVITRGTSI